MNWLPALGLALAVAAPGPKEDPKKPAPPSIIGEWECVALVAGGQTVPAKELTEIGIKVEFTSDGKFKGRQGRQVFPEGTYRIDATKDLPEVDYNAGDAARGNKGIFKVEKDALTICVTEGGGDRPKTFGSPAGTRIMLMTFKRVEKAKE